MADLIAVDLCCGTGSVGLSSLGVYESLTGVMGSKRRWMGLLALAAYGPNRPDHLVLVDAGPWGDTLHTLVNGGAADVEKRLREEHKRGPLNEVWPSLLTAPPDDPVERAVQYLMIQARTPNNIPAWWDGRRWTAPTGSKRVHAAGQKKVRVDAGVRPTLAQTGRPAQATLKAGQRGSVTNNRRRVACLPGPIASTRRAGLVRTATLANRVARLRRLPLDRVTVIRKLVQDVEPIPGSRVFFDPPYLGSTRYAKLLGREQVLGVCRSWGPVVDTMLVSEGEALPLEGWSSWKLAKREWVTAIGVHHRPFEQLDLIQ